MALHWPTISCEIVRSYTEHTQENSTCLARRVHILLRPAWRRASAPFFDLMRDRPRSARRIRATLRFAQVGTFRSRAHFEFVSTEGTFASSMGSSDASPRDTITLKGSTSTVTEFFQYALSSILYQRGVYPPENFEPKKQYGLTVMAVKDTDLSKYLSTVLGQFSGTCRLPLARLDAHRSTRDRTACISPCMLCSRNSAPDRCGGLGSFSRDSRGWRIASLEPHAPRKGRCGGAAASSRYPVACTGGARENIWRRRRRR